MIAPEGYYTSVIDEEDYNRYLHTSGEAYNRDVMAVAATDT